MFVNELTGFPAQSLREAPMFPSREEASARRFAPSKGPGILVVSCVLLTAVAVYAAVYTIVVQLSTIIFSALFRHDGHLASLEIDAGALACGVLVCTAALFWVLRGLRMARDIKAALVESNASFVIDRRFKPSIPSVPHLRDTVQHVGSDVRPRRPFPPSKIEAAR
jgi:hypothetical protein